MKMRNYLIAVVGFGLVVGSTMPASAATIHLSDNFNSENGGTGALNYTGFENWEVKDGTVDIHGNGSEYAFESFESNGLYVDLDGSSNDAGTLQSKETFSFNQNETLELSFDILGQNPDYGTDHNEVTVSLGDIFSKTFDISDKGTIEETITVNSDTNANLVFNHNVGGDNYGDNNGLIMDNVRLAVPEPTTILGSLTALGFGGFLKRKFAKKA